MNRFEDHYYRNYLVKKFSLEHLFCIFCYYLMIALPFYFCFGGSNFWLKQNHNLMTTKIKYTGLYALQINTVQSTTSQVSTNIPGTLSNFKTIQQHKVDVYQQINQTIINIQIGQFSLKTISSINFIIYYDVNIPLLQKKVYSGFMISIQGNARNADSYGILQFTPSIPISGLSTNQLNTPLYYPNLQIPQSFQNLVQTFKSNKFKISGNIKHSIIQQSAQTRTINIVLSKKIVTSIPYYPQILQTLKFSFVKFFAFFLIAYIFLKWFITINVKQGTIITKISNQIPHHWN